MLALLLAGCGQSDDAAIRSGEIEDAQGGISYTVKNGLLVSPETAEFIGLKMEEVTERAIAGTQEISSRVFRVATADAPHTLASVLIPAHVAALLHTGYGTLATSPSSPASIIQITSDGAGQPGMVEAILQLNDPERTLTEGMTVTVKFTTGDTNAVVAVPNAALFHTTAGDFVYLENGEHFTRAAVKPGRTDGEFTEIAEGLFAGDRVVTRAVKTLWMTELHNVNGGDACCIKQEAK